MNNSHVPSEDESVSLKEFLEQKIESLLKLIGEKDILYDTRFKASETAVNVALAAQEKAVAAAFLASDKAIIKAEEAQKEYNSRSNEFRGQLDDQAKTLMPRSETSGLLKGVDDRFDIVQKQVDDLRLSKAQLEGKASQQSVNQALVISVLGVVIGIIGIILRFL
jgi:hypothetical protein